MTVLNNDKEAKKRSSGGVSAALVIAYVSVAIDLLGVSIIVPVIPQLVDSFGGDAFTVGVIFASYGGAQAVSMPISGYLSDRYGRRPMILISLAGSCVGFFCQGFTRTIGSFIGARILAGSFGGSIPIVQAFIADTYSKEERPRYLALLSSVLALSFMFGPGIGAGLAQFSIYTPMLFSSGLAFMGLVLAFFYFKESKTKSIKSESSADEGIASDEDVELSELAIKDVENGTTEKYLTSEQAGEEKEEDFEKFKPMVYLLWCVAFLLMGSYSSFLSVYGYLVLQTYGWKALEVGFVGTGTALVAVITQIALFSRLYKSIGKHATGMVGFIVFGVGLAMLPIGPEYVEHPPQDTSTYSMLITVISLLLTSVGYALAQPALSSTISRYASSSSQGRILGTSQAMQAMARVVAPIALGAVYQDNASAPFFITGGTAFLAALIFYYVLHLNRRLGGSDEPLIGSIDESEDATEITPLVLNDEERKEAAEDLGGYLVGMLSGRGINVADAQNRKRVKKTLCEIAPLLKEAKAKYGEDRYVDVLHSFIASGTNHRS